ncbi:hypothetical protein AB205_0180310 [Aquarana catesbeiana]|uniref:Uncharacterized protein n=1 Tax=Aquarana catesbeiana TaxID=8400 RepID=A0A2G9SDA6_AQUCT|nr:hypothetical protein AB205_0180310 [Aquarana catesbeiana]
MVTNVQNGATVRTEPSVTTSMGPACVSRALKASSVRSECAQKDCTASSVTRTAPVT